MIITLAGSAYEGGALRARRDCLFALTASTPASSALSAVSVWPRYRAPKSLAVEQRGKMRALSLCLVVLALLVVPEDCARILALLPTVSHSHHIWCKALMTALAERGHDVIVVTPDQDKDQKNLRYIHLENSYESFEANTSITDWATFTPLQNALGLMEECYDICVHQFQTKGFKELLSLKGPFDLLIVDTVVNECFFGFIPYFKAPVIAVSPYGYSSWNCEQMGMPDPMAVYPQPLLPYTTEMSFEQRANNVFLTLYSLYIRKYDYMPKNEKLARTVFGEEMPPLNDIERTFSLFLVNSGPEIDSPRAHPPSVVEVGCLHCRPGKPLPQDIQEFLDGATEGAIFFSLGSNVRSDKMTPETLQAFLAAFSKLPQRVLWKWESDTLPGQPANVKLGKWLPQQDILAHPNVRLFITHGGRLSSQEAVYHGVPVLSVPVFFDQYMNSRRTEQLGLGVTVGLAKVTEHALSSSLEQLLGHDRFLVSARRQSAVSRDQPETPLERAVFWTEYVLRHKGAPHFRSATLGLAWYQLHLIDMVAAVLATLLLLFVVTFILICSLRTQYCAAPTTSQQQQQQLQKKKTR